MNEHKKNLVYYACISLEMLVSGYFNQIDFFWIATRFFIFVIIFSAIHTKKSLVLKFAPLLFVFLSLQGIREKWHSIAAEKLSKQESSYNTKIVKPEKPLLPNCIGETKWRKELCEQKSEKLQLAYSVLLEKYNSRIEKSESEIRKIEIELTAYEQQPIWIYVLLSMACIGLTIISSIDEKDIVRETKKEIDSGIELNDLRQKILNRIHAGLSNSAIQRELGIDRRKIAQIKKEFVQSKVKQSSTDAQSDVQSKKIVNIREVKREA